MKYKLNMKPRHVIALSLSLGIGLAGHSQTTYEPNWKSLDSPSTLQTKIDYIDLMQMGGIAILMHAQSPFTTNSFRLTLDPNGAITELTDTGRDINYAASKHSYLLGVRMSGAITDPVGFQAHGGHLTYQFPENVRVDLDVISKGDYLRLEVTGVSGIEKMDAIMWGPFRTTISGTIGEFVGVVRNWEYAIGIQSLNVKTTGGALINDEGYVPPRGSAALKQEYGSSLQAFCINRTFPQEIEVWNGFGNTRVVPDPGFGLEGSAIALFGVEESAALDLIGRIEVEEGLPHMMIDGEWVKNSPLAGRPYIISNFGESTIDMMLDFTEKVGFYSLYQSHPFETWGHFELIPSLFPNGRDGMKACVEKARKRNIRLGVHTLTNFITTNDPFVTSVPHEGLAIYAQTVITRDVGPSDREIQIDDSTFYHKKTTLQTVRAGNELIRFSGISEQRPFKLLNCKRGAFGTKATSHEEGEGISRLIDHPYKTFYPNMDLQNEMIDRLAGFFNETGVSHMDFDGHEGAYSTGYGDASKDYFALRFLEGVDHSVVNGTSQPSHFYWHLNTYMNWGEPWYGGMRESHNEIRFNNQAVLERNYQPNMLGWFWYQAGTTLEEMEWMLARAAGWNAGYALVVNPIALSRNPNNGEVIEAIKTWEEAKNRHIFNKPQKELLKAGENDFSLVKVSDNEFHLQHYRKESFSHENLVLQPGQPHYSDWEFTSAKGEELYFRLGTSGEEGSIEEIILELDGTQTLEIPGSLKAGYSCIFDGKGNLLIYDARGTLKKKMEVEWGQIKLDHGSHSLRVTCHFSSDSDIVIQGVIKMKGKLEIIHP